MNKQLVSELSRRERQILDSLYQLGQGSVAEVLETLPDPPSYSSVRTLLGILEEKGYVNHERQGKSYIYTPTVARTTARRMMLRHVMQTFFDGSMTDVVATLIDLKEDELTEAEYRRLVQLIETRQQRQEEK